MIGVYSEIDIEPHKHNTWTRTKNSLISTQMVQIDTTRIHTVKTHFCSHQSCFLLRSGFLPSFNNPRLNLDASVIKVLQIGSPSKNDSRNNFLWPTVLFRAVTFRPWLHVWRHDAVITIYNFHYSLSWFDYQCVLCFNYYSVQGLMVKRGNVRSVTKPITWFITF